MRRRILIASLIAIAAIATHGGYLWSSFNKLAEDFQHDADIVRLQHLKHYGDLIEEYHAKIGKYPFEGTSKVPIYVHIANDLQTKNAPSGPPTPHKPIPVADFIAELEKGLGRTIKERYDPQLGQMGKPNWYVYMLNKDYYFFAVHLHEPQPFANKIAENYYKVEISSVANGKNRACDPKLLFESPEFKAATAKPMLKQGFFADRDKQYEAFTKAK